MIIFVEAGRRVESPEVRMSIPEDRIMGPGEDAIFVRPLPPVTNTKASAGSGQARSSR